MTNYFAVLGLEPRPWLDEEVVKSRYLELSGTIHPDKATAENRADAERNFAELNAAQTTLRNPRERLLHLLASEGLPGGRHVQNVPPMAMELFGEMGLLLRETDLFLATKSKSISPMVQAQFFSQGLEWTDRLQSTLHKLHQQIQKLHAQVQAIDQRWSELAGHEKGDALQQLEEISRSLGFFGRWSAQIQERIHALAF